MTGAPGSPPTPDACLRRIDGDKSAASETVKAQSLADGPEDSGGQLQQQRPIKCCARATLFWPLVDSYRRRRFADMSHHIVFGSREWPIPERLPAGLVARLSVGDQRGAFIELLGEEGYRALCDWGATVEDAAFLWLNVEKLYGVRFRRRADIRIHRQAKELAARGRRVQAFGFRLIARTVWPRQRGRPKGLVLSRASPLREGGSRLPSSRQLDRCCQRGHGSVGCPPSNRGEVAPPGSISAGRLNVGSQTSHMDELQDDENLVVGLPRFGPPQVSEVRPDQIM
jgi:hypothetical protein